MSRRARIWLFASLGLLLWLLLVWLLGRLLELEGSDRWILNIGLGLLGVFATGVLVWYFLRELRDKEGPPPPGQGDEIDNAIATARSRLVSAKYAERSRLSQLPMVVALGAPGSAKTTVILRSGLDPDLLAGEVQRGDATVATRVVNLWYSSKTIFLEVGGKLNSDSGRFTRLIKHLQPSRLAAVLSAGSQAPRIAVVCLSIEDLTKPGGAEQVMANARELRARLLEISQRLGIRLPVYVMFTKADRIPYFTDFVRNFSQDEAREVFGTTLPFDVGSASTYADRTSTRVTNSMQKLAGALAIQRLQFLPRESQPDAIYGGYEFAREFRKVIPLASQFLVEVCRPSQLEVSPVLRGFYFTGVRAIIVDDGVAAQAPAAQRQADPLNMDATQAFVPAMYGIAQAPAGPVGSTSRKVPQWVFLGRFFKDVVLKDRVALAATAGGAKVNLLRRAALATITALTVLFIFGFIISFAANRKLEHRAEATVRNIIGATLPPGDVLGTEALQRLDSLRVITQQLGSWQRDGAPLRYRWGLYTGKSLYARLRSIYFIQFDSLLYAPAHANLVRDLRNMPQVPTDRADYPASYNTLKGHLIVTAFPEKSTPEFLGPVLTRAWGEDIKPNEERTALALAQFSYFASELPHGNPLPLDTDTSAVRNARAYLKMFLNESQIYQIMRADANKQATIPAFEFARAFPGASVVQAPYVVEGAFTRRGWSFMQDALKNITTYLSGEEWVVGTDRPSESQIRNTTNAVRDMYRADYIKAWQTMLAQAKVAQFAGIGDAAKKLNLLGGNPSPLMQLFNTVSLNVAVDSAMAATVFYPVTVVSPPDSTRLFGDKTDPYLQAVLAVGTAMEQVAGAAPGQADGPVGDAKTQAATAKNAARNLGLAFGSDPRSVSPDVNRLLLDPLGRIDGLLGGVGVGALNRSGGDLCSGPGRVLLKAPFNPNGVAASVEEVNAFFGRTDGALVNLFNGQLSNYMMRQSGGYVVKPTSAIKINPRFRDFFTKAMQVTTALYPEGQPGPRLAFTFRALVGGDIKFATFTVDGVSRPFSQNRGGDQAFTWIANESQEARIEPNVGGNVQVLKGTGQWSVFQLFAKATNWKSSNGRYTAEWTFTHDGGKVTLPFELNLLGNPSIFDTAWLRGLSCVSQIGTP
jgi:type VI secretion system protein ImpL